MIVIKGYRAESTDFAALEDLLLRLQDLVRMQGHKLFAELLASEIETVVDDISLNIIPRPGDTSIYNTALRVLDQKISNATGRNLALPYNFGIQMAVYSYKGGIYIRLNTNNERLIKALRAVPTGLNDYSVYDNYNESEDNKKREAVWNEIREIYTTSMKPLVVQFLACENANPQWKQISAKFHSRSQRAEMRIRHRLTSTLLNMLGMGKEIPPHKLLPYTEEALSYLDADGIKADAQRMMPQVLQSIINITEELVKRDPMAQAQYTFEKAEGIEASPSGEASA